MTHQYKVRVCSICSKEYIPTNSRQQFCPQCRLSTRLARNREAFHRFTLAHPEQIKAYNAAAHIARYPGDLKKHYGITVPEYNEILAVQGGKCAACGSLINTVRGKIARMSIDHDHKTGRVRGLLCNSCNLALGYAHDDLKILTGLVKYLTDT